MPQVIEQSLFLFLVTKRISGTRGELRWDGEASGGLSVFDFATRKETRVEVDHVVPDAARTRGHKGADFFLMSAFVNAVSAGGGGDGGGGIKTGAEDSVRSHKLVFAAERARRSNTIESVDL